MAGQSLIETFGGGWALKPRVVAIEIGICFTESEVLSNLKTI